MEQFQKDGLKGVAFGVGLMTFAFVMPLLWHQNFKGVLLSYMCVFFASYFIILGAAMLWKGSALETILGPLRSEQRRRNVKFYGLIFAIPAAMPCLLLYFVPSHAGY